MIEIPERVNYGEWDKDDFIIPAEFELTSDSFLHESIQVFYKAGGLYSDIKERKYKPDGKHHKTLCLIWINILLKSKVFLIYLLMISAVTILT
ncbi:MAG: hypothetical protein UC708_05980 [Anaerovoracaceae bacterium]|nr:hypothetical protein [Bacillota bacterium]MEE0517413.1 hypothetical protein [Anaerovoracaceae bacterium]